MPFADIGAGIKPASGAKLYFYEIDGVTPKDTYSDQLSTPTVNANPVESNGIGVFPDIYISGKYKVTLKNRDGVQFFGGAEIEESLLLSNGITTGYATTLDLISSVAFSSNGDIAVTTGYALKGDGGSGSWVQDGVTGQTPSQNPAQLGGARLTDALGNQWALVTDDEPLNVRKLGAVGDGATDDTLSIQAALSTSAVHIPSGVYYVSDIQIKSDMLLTGDGMGKTIIQRPSHLNSASGLLYTTFTLPVESVCIRDITLTNQWGHDGGDYSLGTNNTLFIQGVKNVDISYTEVTNSGAGSIYMNQCDYVDVSHCKVRDSKRDGIRAVSYITCNIKNNNLLRILDDAIAAPNSPDLKINLMTQVNITGNNLIDSQGIQALGCKAVNISGNIITRPMYRGIFVGVSETGVEGSTPGLAIQVKNNIITDVLNGRLFNWAPGAFGILIDHHMETSKDVIGSPNGVGGVFAPWNYTYLVDTEFSKVNAGIMNIDVSGNSVVRTLPEVANYSDYGFGERFTRAGYLNPSVSKSDMCQYSLRQTGSLNNAKIYDNTFVGTEKCIYLFGGGDSLTDTHRNTKIYGNTFSVFEDAAILLNGKGQIEIDNNTFDADPYYEHPNRMPGGAWNGGQTNPTSVTSQQTTITPIMTGNIFKNINKATADSVTRVYLSKLYMDPLDNSGAVVNKGIGSIPLQVMNDAKSVVITDLDPNSSTFGEVKNICLVTSFSLPTSGVYPDRWITKNASLNAGYGWKRLKTGDKHVLGVDWIAI